MTAEQCASLYRVASRVGLTPKQADAIVARSVAARAAVAEATRPEKRAALERWVGWWERKGRPRD